jgi:hypothetical protein
LSQAAIAGRAESLRAAPSGDQRNDLLPRRNLNDPAGLRFGDLADPLRSYEADRELLQPARAAERFIVIVSGDKLVDDFASTCNQRPGGQECSRGVESRWSWRSESSILSIASEGSVLSIGSAGSVLSIGSIGSVGSLLSLGSACSVASALSFAARDSLLSARARGCILGSPMSRWQRLVAGVAFVAAGVAFLKAGAGRGSA